MKEKDYVKKMGERCAITRDIVHKKRIEHIRFVGGTDLVGGENQIPNVKKAKKSFGKDPVPLTPEGYIIKAKEIRTICESMLSETGTARSAIRSADATARHASSKKRSRSKQGR